MQITKFKFFRKSVVVSHVVAAVFICLNAPVYAQGNTPQEIQASCKKFVQGFYNWYIPSLSKSANSPSPSIAIESKKSSFDPVLYRKLKDDFDASAKVSGEIVGLDFDPYLNAQDFGDKYIVSKVTPKKNGTYWVDVHSIMGGKRNPKPDVTPEVAYRNGKWQFVNFHYGKSDIPVNENLISILNVLKKDREKYGTK